MCVKVMCSEQFQDNRGIRLGSRSFSFLNYCNDKHVSPSVGRILVQFIEEITIHNAVQSSHSCRKRLQTEHRPFARLHDPIYVHANPHRDSESNSQTRYIHDLTARSAIASPIHGVAVWIYPAPSTTTCSTWLLNSSVGFHKRVFLLFYQCI